MSFAFTHSAITTLCLLGLSWSSDSHARDQPPPEAASGLKPVQIIHSPTQRGQSGICVTANPDATQACLQQLQAGGSAADGALAAAWMLGLVEPQSSGLGGGGYLVYFDGKHVINLDGRETAPQLALSNRFLRPNGQPLGFREAVVSGLSVGTPSMVALMQEMHRRFGQRPWASSLQPAIAMAKNGFAVGPRLHQLLRLDQQLAQSSAAEYFYPNGQALAVGVRRTNPAYAQTLSQIAQHGSTVFYQGSLAANISSAIQAHNGDLTIEDLARYQVTTHPALCQTLTSYQVCGMGPSSSGGIAVLQSLAMLQGQYTDNAITNMTRLTNAERLAFADRDAYLADDQFVNVPTPALLDPNYLKQRQRLAIGPRLNQVQAGLIQRAPSGEGIDAPNTTHISVVDAQGRAASMTLSIESAFGSRIWIKSGGFLLNNELTDFSFVPQKNGQQVANRVQAGKRPRSSMSPTLILNAEGKQVDGVLGSPGGSQIIGYVVQAAWGLINGQTVRDVLEQPHVLRRGDDTELEQGRFSDKQKQALIDAGHSLKEGEMTSGLAIIWRQNDRFVAGADPRREGTALAVHPLSTE